MKRLLAIALCCAVVPMIAHAETRCGWLSNPVPKIGGYSHGYACFCLDVRTNDDGQVEEIFSSKQLPLSKCRNDDALSEPLQD